MFDSDADTAEMTPKNYVVYGSRPNALTLVLLTARRESR
jgi:hypothetical protein